MKRIGILYSLGRIFTSHSKDITTMTLLGKWHVMLCRHQL